MEGSVWRLLSEKLADDKWWQKLSIEKLTKSWKLNLCNKNKIEIKVIVLVQEWLVQYKYQIRLCYYANNSQQLRVQVSVTGSICHGLSEILQGYLILVLYKSLLHQHYNLANQKHELPVVAMFVNESGRNEQSL
jgi:hypothetical protein